MLSVARRPRNLVLLALATVLAVIFVLLGRWQLGVAENHAHEDTLRAGVQQPVVPLGDLLKPQEGFPNDSSLRRVSFSGHYEADKQFLVPDRRLDGRRGYWVLTPVVVDGTGARMTVLRGFTTTPTGFAEPTSGTVRLVGYLAPSESSAPADLPKGQHASVDLPTLVNEWGGQVYNAFVFTAGQQPAASMQGLHHVPPPDPDTGGVDARNLGYAIQWWVFAFFAYYLWWRMVREDWRDEQARRALHRPDDGGSGPEPRGNDPAPDRPDTEEAHV